MATQTVGTPATYQNVKFEREGTLAVVTLNRPSRRNALSLDLMYELTDCLSAIGRDREIHVVILAAAGSVFCSGHDLGEMVRKNINDYRHIYDTCTDLMTKIQSIPQPVIAEVHGTATAAGCQLVATCDLAVASDKAAFATPGVKIGLFCTTPMVALSRAIGRKRALQMLLTGEMISAATAAEWGLVNVVVPADTLTQETRKLALKVAAASMLTLALGEAGVLRSNRPRPAQGLCLRQGSDEHELAGDGRSGRHLGFSCEKAGVLVRALRVHRSC